MCKESDSRVRPGSERIAVRVWASALDGVDHRSHKRAAVVVNQPDAEASAELKTRASIHVRVQSCRHAGKLGETFS